MEKGTSQFCWSAGRCGAMRRGVPAGMLPRPGHAAAKAAPMGRQPRPRHGPMGKQPRPRHAAKAKAAPMGRQPRPRHACVHAAMAKAKAMAAPMGRQPRPRHAAKAKARSQGLGMLAWARWHALGTPTRPWQHLGGLLLPSLDSLFGHLQLFPP